MVAIDSLAISIGPPGSANEIAIPATNGARRTRTHSSSVKSLFVVMTHPPSPNVARHAIAARLSAAIRSPKLGGIEEES
jgi:hypothetical protein